jgi:hypothetical protein
MADEFNPVDEILKEHFSRLRERISKRDDCGGGHLSYHYSINIKPDFIAAIETQNPNRGSDIRMDFSEVRFTYIPKTNQAIVIKTHPILIDFGDPDGVKRFINALRSAIWDKVWPVFNRIERAQQSLNKFCEDIGKCQWYYDET